MISLLDLFDSVCYSRFMCLSFQIFLEEKQLFNLINFYNGSYFFKQCKVHSHSNLCKSNFATRLASELIILLPSPSWPSVAVSWGHGLAAPKHRHTSQCYIHDDYIYFCCKTELNLNSCITFNGDRLPNVFNKFEKLRKKNLEKKSNFSMDFLIKTAGISFQQLCICHELFVFFHDPVASGSVSFWIFHHMLAGAKWDGGRMCSATFHAWSFFNLMTPVMHWNIEC